MIKALMVDVDGVLVHGRPEDGLHWSTSLQEDLGLHPNDLHREFFAVHWEDVVAGRACLEESLGMVLDRIAPSLTAGQLIAYWFERDSRLDQRLLQELATIRAMGIGVQLATNQEHRRAQYLMDVVGLRDYVDGIQYSAGLGARKPFGEFYDRATATLGLPADQLLLVDDSMENIRAAETAGWKACHWTGGKSLVELLENWK